MTMTEESDRIMNKNMELNPASYSERADVLDDAVAQLRSSAPEAAAALEAAVMKTMDIGQRIRLHVSSTDVLATCLLVASLRTERVFGTDNVVEYIRRSADPAATLEEVEQEAWRLADHQPKIAFTLMAGVAEYRRTEAAAPARAEPEPEPEPEPSEPAAPRVKADKGASSKRLPVSDQTMERVRRALNAVPDGEWVDVKRLSELTEEFFQRCAESTVRNALYVLSDRGEVEIRKVSGRNGVCLMYRRVIRSAAEPADDDVCTRVAEPEPEPEPEEKPKEKPEDTAGVRCSYKMHRVERGCGTGSMTVYSDSHGMTVDDLRPHLWHIISIVNQENRRTVNLKTPFKTFSEISDIVWDGISKRLGKGRGPEWDNILCRLLTECSDRQILFKTSINGAFVFKSRFVREGYRNRCLTQEWLDANKPSEGDEYFD